MSEWIRIRIKDFYRDPVGEKEYVCVSKEVYDILADTFRKEEHAQEMRDYRHLTRGGYSEGTTEELAFEQGNCLEDIVILRMDVETLYKAMESLTVQQRERLSLYFIDGLALRQIAERKGISYMAAWQSIEIALEKVKKFFD